MSELAIVDETQKKQAISTVPNELQPAVAGLAALIGPVFWYCSETFMLRLKSYYSNGMTKEDFHLVCRQFKRPEVQSTIRRDSDFLAVFAGFVAKAAAFRAKREAEKKAVAVAQENAKIQKTAEELARETAEKSKLLRGLIDSFTSAV